ncbi:S-adenosyl-L-methionine-dependent methyltransferase [Limtongia smithiae]|uniref:S-adenosyl-L-methionine-dependent methyltransferase n=1 Tax=Limtongia smithiae TaxID=1125753 RepID=UPI0034CDF776
MTSFSDSSYGSKAYADFRPSYPSKLYTVLLDYHQGAKTFAIDQGCGPGTAALPLAAYFTKVIGTDPSAGMIEQATKAAAAKHFTNVQFMKSPAEEIPFAANGSVDFISASQAAHWFDHDKWFNETARVLRPGGTLTFFGYLDHTYKNSPIANEIIQEFSYGKNYLGPYWEPGRYILRNLYRDIHPPTSLFRDIERQLYIPGQTDEAFQMVAKTMTLAASEEYVRTWSSFHNWCKEHPGEIARRHNGEGDIVDRLFDRLRGSTGWTDKTVLEIEWSSVIALCRRR